MSWASLRWQDIVDFLVLATAFYGLIRWASRARALRLALGIAGLRAAALLALHFNLMITSWVFNGTALIAVVVLVLVFQAELRRTLMRLDSRMRLLVPSASGLKPAYDALGEAAFALARRRLGALIVLVRRDSIDELTDGGIALGAEISQELVEAVFERASPLHDGALTVVGDRIAKAGVVLPLTLRSDVPTMYGTRHRAAMGIAERSDALVVVVSEERGEVRVMHGRHNELVENSRRLADMLASLQEPRKSPLATTLRRALTAHAGAKLAAVGLAALVWGTSFLAAGTAERIVTIPVEFSNVPEGMGVSELSTPKLAIELRGAPWLLDSIDLTRLISRFDLSAAKPGRQTLRVGPDTVSLPPGIVMERVWPEWISFRLVSQRKD